MKKQVAILGSTGSIGTQTLDVIRSHADKFEARILTAGENVDLLIKQAIEFQPDAVVIAKEEKYDQLCHALAPYDIKTYAGDDAIAQVAAFDHTFLP